MNSGRTRKSSVKRIFLLPFSHLDLFWLGNRHECFSRGSRIFREAIRLCERDNSFRFLIEDAVFLSNFVNTVPEMKSRLMKLMKEGRIEGPAKWAAITTTNVNGETIVRDMQHGFAFARDFCGVKARAIHLGDLPGHPAQFPQIAAGFGLKGVVLSRGGPAKTPLFRWKGPDGSAVAAWYSPKCYNWGMDFARPGEDFQAKHAARLAGEAEAIGETTPSHILMHCGWDLSVPTDHILENVRCWNERAKLPMRLGTQEEFFGAVDGTRELPELEGEIPTVWGNWPDAAYLDVTIHHAPAERALLWAERMAALGMLEGQSPRGEIEVLQRAWRGLCESLDHNYSLIATEEVHESKNMLSTAAVTAAESITNERMARIAGAMARPPNSTPVVVFNPSSFARSGCVRQRVVIYGDVFANAGAEWAEFHLEDEAGSVTPMQEMSRRLCGANQYDVAFVAEDVPALGHRTYYLKSGKASLPSEGQPPGTAKAPGTLIETARMHASVCRQTGVVKLERKDGGVLIERLQIRGVEQDERNQVMQLRSTGRIFPFMCRGVSMTENAPVLKQIVLDGLVGDTPAKVVVSLPVGLDEMEVAVTLEHSGRGFLRVQLHAELPGGRAEDGYVGCPFGANPFSNVMPGCGPSLGDEVHPDEWPRIREAQDWFLARGKATAEALAVGTERKLIELLPEGFAVNILSSMTAKWIRPDKVFHPFAGTYETRFSIRPVAPDDIGAAARHGESLFMPLRAFCDYGANAQARGPSRASAIRIAGDAVCMTALKPAEDGNGIVARFVESTGRRVRTAIELAGAERQVQECNLLEEPVKPADLSSMRFRPFEIKTFRFGPKTARADHQPACSATVTEASAGNE